MANSIGGAEITGEASETSPVVSISIKSPVCHVSVSSGAAKRLAGLWLVVSRANVAESESSGVITAKSDKLASRITLGHTPEVASAIMPPPFPVRVSGVCEMGDALLDFIVSVVHSTSEPNFSTA